MEKIKILSYLGITTLILSACNAKQIDTDSANTSESVTTTQTISDTKLGDISLSSYYDGDYYGSILNTYTDASTLKNQLNQRLNNGFKSQSYTSDSTHLQTIDCYDGTYVECLYTGVRLDKDGVTKNQWNKEHIWAKSLGFGDQAYAAYSDLHHLRATQNFANNLRSNKYFAEGGDKSEYGYSTTSTTYEPRDEVKGDVARMILYMTVMYDSDTLDLELTNDTSIIITKTGGDAYIGLMDTLLNWNMIDPVDSREMSRNDAIYNIQGNRNPFIDHPAIAYYLYEEEYNSLGYTINDAQTLEISRTLKDDSKISNTNSIIKSIPQTVTSENAQAYGELLEEANASYSALDDESKSFVSEYVNLVKANQNWETYQSALSQDVTRSTAFSLTSLGNTDGTLIENGIVLEYTSSSQAIDKGIYIQSSKPLSFSVSNLYSSLKTFNIKLKTNKSSGEGSIYITDGTNSNTTSYTFTTTLTTYTIDLSNYDITKTLVITINYSGKNSLIASVCSFEI